VTRTALLHHRRLDFHGFRRSDGLFEVEARLTDRKPHDFAPPSDARVVRANEPIHDMGVRVAFDDDMVVRAVETFMFAWPYNDCPHGGDVLQAMIGARIGAGWSGEVRRRLPISESCAHLREMLIPLATAAFQTMTVERLQRPTAVDASGRPLKVDSCYAYGAAREIVMQRWPAFHRPAAAEKK
jgi:hypothetical protein